MNSGIIVSDANSSDSKNKLARDCYLKANQAMEKRNFDYAVKMYGTAVQLVPDNLMFRQNLRGCERKMYNENKSGAKLASLKLTGVRSRIRKARSKKEWVAMDQAAEEGLTINPWDPQLNADMAEACFNLDRPELAEYGYRIAVEYDPDNKVFLQKLGELNELRGNYREAIECWRKISKLEPNNGKIRAKLTGLEASAVMDRGGYDEAKTTQDVRRNAYDDYRPVTGKSAPETVAGPGVSEEADLQRAIRKAPADKGNYLKLADLYQAKKEFAKAGAVLKQALDSSGGDTSIREIIDQNDLKDLRHQIELGRAVAAKDESAQQKVKALRRELHSREIEVFSSLVERYPMDSGHKYELASRLMISKKFKEAIPLLQGAVKDQRREPAVRVALGKCLIADEQPGMALNQFKKAVEKLNPHDNPELFCEAEYRLGVLYEQSGENEEAQTAYSEVLSVNYAYEDARERLENLQRGKGKRASG